MPKNKPTEEQMKKTREAVVARARYRQGKGLALHTEQAKKEEATAMAPEDALSRKQ